MKETFKGGIIEGFFVIACVFGLILLVAWLFVEAFLAAGPAVLGIFLGVYDSSWWYLLILAQPFCWGLLSLSTRLREKIGFDF